MRRKQCDFCFKNIDEIDFKDTELLKNSVSGSAKIRARKKTGVCAKHQRRLKTAIKRARYLGLLPFVPR